MSVFIDDELAYLREGRRLARVATVGADGTPHVVPVGWSLSDDLGAIEIGGRDFASTSASSYTWPGLGACRLNSAHSRSRIERTTRVS